MKKLFLLLLSVATLLFYFSCQQLPTESEKPVNTVSVLNLEADGINYDLIAGQNITVGNVFVWNDGTDLHVEYNITDLDWCLTETHMHVATTLDGIPQTKKGNPIPGQFDYKNEDLINCATFDSYTIPLDDIDPDWFCDQELFIATHAVVLESQEETAWGGEEPFPGRNWATYFYYEVTCETPPPPGFCDGNEVKALLVQYTGEDCSATDNNQDPSEVECAQDPAFSTPVRILAQDKASPTDLTAKIWFDGQVTLTSTFLIDADFNNLGEAKLKAETFVFIYDLQGFLLQTIKFHTSCSQPLDEGDQFGSILMIDFIPFIPE